MYKTRDWTYDSLWNVSQILISCVDRLCFTTAFFPFSPAFLFLWQALRNVNRCWLHFQGARCVMGQKNNWRQHLFSARLGNWIPFPSHTRELVIADDKFLYFINPNPACSVWWTASERWWRRFRLQFLLHTFLDCTTETPCGGKSQTRPQQEH